MSSFFSVVFYWFFFFFILFSSFSFVFVLFHSFLFYFILLLSFCCSHHRYSLFILIKPGPILFLKASSHSSSPLSLSFLSFLSFLIPLISLISYPPNTFRSSHPAPTLRHSHLHTHLHLQSYSPTLTHTHSHSYSPSYSPSDNYQYDSIEGTNDWARISLQLHEADVRAVLYTQLELEGAHTHDDLWNAAQIQMTRDGKMHVSLVILYHFHSLTLSLSLFSSFTISLTFLKFIITDIGFENSKYSPPFT